MNPDLENWPLPYIEAIVLPPERGSADLITEDEVIEETSNE